MNDKIAGLLTGDQNQFMGLLGNPLFNVGMGLLAARQDGRINPYGAAMNGLTTASQFRMLEQDRKRELEERERLDKAREAASKIIGGMFPAQQVEMGPPAPDGSMTRGTVADPMAQLLQQVAYTDGPAAALDLAAQFQQQDQGMTANIQDFKFRQSLSPEQGALWDQMHARNQNNPAILQEMEWLRSPNRTQQELDAYWAAKRAGNLFDVGGVANYRQPGPGNQVTPLATVDAVAGNESVRGAATSDAETTARLQAEARQKYAPMSETAASTRNFIQRLKDHPGREAATGGSAWFNPIVSAMPFATDRRDFMALLDTAQGKQFAVAYETLKGGGAITQIETEQATKALGNLMAAQSEGQFLQALDDFQAAIDSGVRKMGMQAGINQSPKVEVRGILGEKPDPNALRNKYGLPERK